MKTLVVNWLQAGASFANGARLFALIEGKEHPFNVLLRRKTKGAYTALKAALLRRAKMEMPPPAADQRSRVAADPPARPVKLREDWPFLSNPSCPPELKILAANKITAYHNYIRAHEQLFDCTNPVQQYETVRCLVENYIENRNIVEEFLYYKEHRSVLGKHPVFAEYKEIKALRKLNIVDLIKMKEKLEHTIWRIRSEIKKGDKKHLVADREKRLQAKKNLLAEVERLIAEAT